MKKILVVYKSVTGFTKKYAQWIQEELNCDTIELKDVKLTKINNYDIIIFGGGMHANKLNGVKFIKKNLKRLNNKHFIVYATGATPATVVEEIKKFEHANIPSDNIPFFYFQSGLNYENMRMIDKVIMNSYKLVLKLIRNKNSVEKGTLEAISTSYDHSQKVFIEPLVHYVRGL